jgi:hypothetical protein
VIPKLDQVDPEAIVEGRADLSKVGRFVCVGDIRPRPWADMLARLLAAASTLEATGDWELVTITPATPHLLVAVLRRTRGVAGRS